MRRVAGFALALLPLAACGSAGGASSGGLRGTVTRGPSQPVCRTGEPCTAPAPRVVLVFRGRDRTVRTRTDAAGRYRVTLAPGSWRVSLTRVGIGSTIRPATIRVAAGRVRTVDLAIDTGIR